MKELGRSLGLDIGDKRIGVAVSDPLGIIAQPHKVIKRSSPKRDTEAIRMLIEETGASRIVAGIPLDREGKPGPQAAKVLAFIEILRRVVDVEVVMQDERYTTAAAERALIDADVSRKTRKKVIDKVAAHYILQTYLDRQSRTAADSEG